jgi:hypothetical protein
MVLKLFLPGCDVEANDVLKDEVDVDSNDQHSETDGKDFRSQTYQNIQIVTFLYHLGTVVLNLFYVPHKK